MTTASSHPSLDVLLDWWLHDSDDATTDAVDEHLMHCDACGDAVDALVALGRGVRDAFRAGAVAVATPDAFVQRLADQGLRVREYRLAPGDSVECTVAPDDDVLVTRLVAPLQGVERVDVLQQVSAAPGAPHELHDMPFDAQRGEVAFVSNLAAVRALPAHTLQVTLLAVDAGARRELGHYTFHHRPWAGH